MLDVHPPHHAASTWRDFFIHIATIVIGLLITVALEQTVEAVRHSIERHELIQDFRRECEANNKMIEANPGRIYRLKSPTSADALFNKLDYA